jgi:YesN/AraC family two-component response regulator
MTNGLKPADEKALQTTLQQIKAILERGFLLGLHEARALENIAWNIENRLNPHLPAELLEAAAEEIEKHRGIDWVETALRKVAA